MHKLRLLLLVGLMFAVGGTLVARGQDGSEVFSKQDQKSDSKHEKSKTKANNGHRKHWYSPPHWFHRKHDNTASKVKKSDNKTVAAKNQPAANPVAATSTNKSATATHSGTKTAATSGQHKGTAAGARRRTGTTQAKKTVKTPCTPEQARKTGCHLDKGSSQKGSTVASSGKSS